MKLYIAGRYSRRLELLAYAVACEAAGHTITSRWLHGTHESAIPDEELHLPAHRHVAAAYAREDLEDVRAAEALIAFTEPPLPFASRGGRHVEYGYALACGLRLLVCGPLENVFCALEQVTHCADLAAVLAALAEVLPPCL